MMRECKCKLRFNMSFICIVLIIMIDKIVSESRQSGEGDELRILDTVGSDI